MYISGGGVKLVLVNVLNNHESQAAISDSDSFFGLVLVRFGCFSNGAPRVINSIMTNTRLLGAQLDKKIIDTEIVMAATNNLTLG